MVKLVDTHVSGTCGGNSVKVRVFFRAQNYILSFFIKRSSKSIFRAQNYKKIV